jgi:hypothetical protein
MKKILFFAVVAGFYFVTQQNFTGFGSTGKKTCDQIKIAAKKCVKLLEVHDTKLKQIESAYKNKSGLDYSVNLTAENSAFIENYQLVQREAELASASGEGERSPANACSSDEGANLKTCMDNAKTIYKSLVPN